jgi:cysteine-rich repeat protein
MLSAKIATILAPSLMQRSAFQKSAIGAAVFLMTGMVFMGMHASRGQTPPPVLPVVTHDPADTANGVFIPKSTHNFFSCSTDGVIEGLQTDPWIVENRFWIYEFTGNEPPFDGSFFISPAEVAINPVYGDPTFNNLTDIDVGKRYYVMTQNDLNFSCSGGFSLVPTCGDIICSHTEDLLNCPVDCAVCGDGICTSPTEDILTCPADCTPPTSSSSSSVSSESSESSESSSVSSAGPACGNGQLDGLIPEECDDGNINSGDGCSDTCTEEVGFQCTNPSGPTAPSVCELLIPDLPSHNICIGGFCVEVPGVGTNQCLSSPDCTPVSSASSLSSDSSLSAPCDKLGCVGGTCTMVSCSSSAPACSSIGSVCGSSSSVSSVASSDVSSISSVPPIPVICSITNNNGDSDGTSVPSGMYEVGRFHMVGSAEMNILGMVFTMYAHDVDVNTSFFRIVNNTTNQETGVCALYSDAGAILSGVVALDGTYFVYCTPDTPDFLHLDGTTELSVALKVNIDSTGPQSVLQVWYEYFNDPLRTDFGIGTLDATDSHLFFVDVGDNVQYHCVQPDPPVVRSTIYYSGTSHIHLECRDDACGAMPGTGLDQCTDDFECGEGDPGDGL